MVAFEVRAEPEGLDEPRRQLQPLDVGVPLVRVVQLHPQRQVGAHAELAGVARRDERLDLRGLRRHEELHGHLDVAVLVSVAVRLLQAVAHAADAAIAAGWQLAR